jgi:phage-related tail fiber protein
MTQQIAASDLAKIVPPGTVIYVAMSSAPDGYLKCNGAAISRSTYTALFNAIGTTFGAGNGSSTFNVPDLRGEFIRGWDNGRGVDSGRALGSGQGHAFASHNHILYTEYGTAPTNTSSSTYIAPNGQYNQISPGSYPNSVSIASTGGSETRPRNIALLACIKF